MQNVLTNVLVLKVNVVMGVIIEGLLICVKKGVEESLDVTDHVVVKFK